MTDTQPEPFHAREVFAATETLIRVFRDFSAAALGMHNAMLGSLEEEALIGDLPGQEPEELDINWFVESKALLEQVDLLLQFQDDLDRHLTALVRESETVELSTMHYSGELPRRVQMDPNIEQGEAGTMELLRFQLENNRITEVYQLEALIGRSQTHHTRSMLDLVQEGEFDSLEDLLDFLQQPEHQKHIVSLNHIIFDQSLNPIFRQQECDTLGERALARLHHLIRGVNDQINQIAVLLVDTPPDMRETLGDHLLEETFIDDAQVAKTIVSPEYWHELGQQFQTVLSELERVSAPYLDEYILLLSRDGMIAVERMEGDGQFVSVEEDWRQHVPEHTTLSSGYNQSRFLASFEDGLEMAESFPRWQYHSSGRIVIKHPGPRYPGDDEVIGATQRLLTSLAAGRDIESPGFSVLWSEILESGPAR